MFDPQKIASDITARIARPLAETLNDVRGVYSRYIGFTSQAQPVAIALWTAHTHAAKAADCTPYIRVSSAEPESGKTRTEEIAFHLVHSGVRASSVSASAVFRLIDAQQPTLLVDEVDAIFAPRSEQEDLRSLLNAGYERGNPVYRSVAIGKTWESTAFDAFCPKMLAGIENGRLPDTIMRRSISISLQRKRKGEPAVAKFRKRRDTAGLHALRAELSAWATDEVLAVLEAAYPEPAPGLRDREDDIWEPLLAIADMAGRDWPALARAAAVELHSGETGSESYGVLLLADIRDVSGDEEKISTQDLIHRLVKEGHRGDWADWWGRAVEEGSDIKLKSAGHQLARKLKPYKIEPKQVWIENRNQRGYVMADFAQAFASYLDSPSSVDGSAPSGANDARTLDRRSEGVPVPRDPMPNTPSDQASSVLAFPATLGGDMDPEPTWPPCPECGFWPHQGGHSLACSSFVERMYVDRGTA